MISRRHWCRLASAVISVATHSRRSTLMRWSALAPSSPVVGSSRIIVCGLLTSAAATCTPVHLSSQRRWKLLRDSDRRCTSPPLTLASRVAPPPAHNAAACGSFGKDSRPGEVMGATNSRVSVRRKAARSIDSHGVGGLGL
jgi:hypothetical protein